LMECLFLFDRNPEYWLIFFRVTTIE